MRVSTWVCAWWQAATQDDTSANSILEPAITKYQNPEEADKLMKVQKDLEETKVILHKTIDRYGYNVGRCRYVCVSIYLYMCLCMRQRSCERRKAR